MTLVCCKYNFSLTLKMYCLFRNPVQWKKVIDIRGLLSTALFSLPFYQVMLYRGHPLRTRSRSQKNASTKLNLIVMGQTSSGKTAFVRTMCEYLRSTVIQGTFKESIPMVLKNPLEPTTATYSVSMDIEPEDDDERRISLTITDTPGISSNLSLLENQLRYLCMYIDHQYERTFLEVYIKLIHALVQCLCLFVYRNPKSEELLMPQIHIYMRVYSLWMVTS